MGKSTMSTGELAGILNHQWEAAANHLPTPGPDWMETARLLTNKIPKICK